MKTRFTSLVKIKKNSFDSCERELVSANRNVHTAQQSLDEAYADLAKTEALHSGTMSDLKSQRTLLDIQRKLIAQRRQWLEFATEQANLAREKMQAAYVELEKYKYLDTKEIEQIMKTRAMQEAKALDENALQSYMYRQERQ